MESSLVFTRRDAVAIISINDAPYNRMTLDFIDRLEQLVTEIAADDTLRAVVLTGEGLDNFSVGMNLKQLPQGIERAGGADALFDQRLRVIAAIENMGKPWVVTLFGFCLGGGLELPLGCHFRLAAAEGAQIGLPEMDLGTVPAWGGSARLSKCVGRDHAMDMILRGKKISGPEALDIGLVHEVWPLEELKDQAIKLAQELAAQPALAVRGVMEVVMGNEDRPLEYLLQAERAAVHKTFGTPDPFDGGSQFMRARKTAKPNSSKDEYPRFPFAILAILFLGVLAACSGSSDSMSGDAATPCSGESAQCGNPVPDGNIVLTVSQGGSITSNSGNLDCAAGQTCDYPVSGQAFNDTFTVTPAPGYFFLGWKGDSAASLCQNGGSPCVVSLPAAWPDVEPVHTLEPIFEVDYSWAPVSRSTDNIQLTDSEILPVNQNIFIELEYFDNPDYSCGLSGIHTFEVLGPYNNANLNAPLWVYLHGGGAGYYDAGQIYRTQIGLDANSYNHEESFAALQELDPDHPATGSAQQDRTITRRISDRYRVLVVGYCDHDNYSGLGTPYPNNPTGSNVDGLQAAMAAIEYVATNYSTTDVFVHGTDAGSFGAWSVGQAFHQSGVNLTGLIMDSGIVTPRYDQILSEFIGDAGFPYGAGFDQQGLIDKIGIFANPAMPYHPEATVYAGFDAVPMLVVAGKLDPEAGGNQPAIPAASGAGQGNVEWLYDGLKQAVDAQANSPHQVVLVDGVADAPTMRDVDDTAHDAVDAFVSGVLAGNPPHPSFIVTPPSGIVGQRMMLMGHSFFRPFIDRLPFHVEQAGIVGHSQEKETSGGASGTPLALWNDAEHRANIQAVLDAGDVDLFGMTCCNLELTPEGELVLTPEGNPILILEAYQVWFDYALAQNPDTAFFIGMPWIDFPTDYADATEYGDLWNLFYNTIILPAVDDLRAQYPGVTIYAIPYGQASHELFALFEAGNLPDVSNLEGSSATSLYTDYKGHAGDVLKALIELIWIDAIYGVDLDTYTYDPGYQTDLKALAKSIMDAHDPAYNGPNR